MRFTSTKTTFFMVGAIMLILACNIPTNTVAEPIPTTSSVIPSLEPPTQISILHTVTPVDLPQERSSHAGDYNSSTTASLKKAAGGDRFTFGKFERPFNANTMDTYFPEIDIIDTFVFQDENWVFGTMQLAGQNANKAFSGRYALELDLDRDGKGDWLVVATSPSSKDWTTNGVQVYQDTNKSVGDLAAMYSDENTNGNGFETLVFDQGKGNDADAAWVRISPTDLNTIQIAVKRSVLSNPEKYLINMWAGNSSLDPARFDLNDHFTHEQAGAADPGFEIYYPIKAVSEIDNSCRMAVGFQPTGQEPGLCEVLSPVNPGTCNPTPSQLSLCRQFNGNWNNSTCKCDTPPPIP